MYTWCCEQKLRIWKAIKIRSNIIKQISPFALDFYLSFLALRLVHPIEILNVDVTQKGN